MTIILIAQSISKKLVTNILVGHNAESLSLTMPSDCDVCKTLKVDVNNSDLRHPWDSNQLAESRAFLLFPPKSIDTPFVSFSSTRMNIKTNGLVDTHSACRLVEKMEPKDMLSPYLLRQNLQNLLDPEVDAPAYAFLVPEIYKSIFELSYEVQQKAFEVGSKTPLLLPFCNSFVVSIETYSEFHKFITHLIQLCWEEQQFMFEWFSNWIGSFDGRETGLLIERATALWFGLQPHLRILGTGFGIGYPDQILKNGYLDSAWMTKNQIMINEHQIHYN